MSDDLTPEFKAQFAKSYGRSYLQFPPDLSRCAERVGSGRQCSRANGFGPHGAWCKQHDPDAVKARREKLNAERNAKWAAERAADARKDREAAFRKECAAVVMQIAAGHDDPTGLCRNVVARFDIQESDA